MFIFQSVMAAPVCSSSEGLSFESLKKDVKNIVFPGFIETRIRDFAEKTGSDRDTVLALALRSMEITSNGFERIKNAKWGVEDQNLLVRQASDISSSDFAGGLFDSAARALKSVGLSAKEVDVQRFVSSHIDSMAVSFLMKLKAINTADKILNEKDIEHADFNIGTDRATLTMCFANVACFPIDLLKMKNDPGKVSKVASLIENGKMDKARVTEMFGKNAWENLQVIASSIFKAVTKYLASISSQNISDGFVQYAQNEILNKQNFEDLEEQKKKAKSIVSNRGDFGGGFA